LSLPGCRFVDLQYGDTLAERGAVARDLGLVIEHLDEVDTTNDLDALAALIGACDLIVTVSNVTAHLAGALGKPALVLLPFGRGRMWFWFKDRDDSPWYPSLRLYRQPCPGDWAGVMQRIAADVQARAAPPTAG
jgi:ADP-heptose:LPS heptosyltransferase